MTKYYLAREGLFTTSATKTALQKFGSTTTTTDIVVPGGVNSLNHMIGWVASAGNSTSGTADYFFRTEGNGIGVQEAWALGAMGEITAAAAPITSIPVYYTNVGLKATAGGNVVQLFADGTAATTLGASTVGVVCVFDNAAQGPQSYTRTYDGATSTTQTENTLTAAGSVTTAPATSPPNISRLARITSFVASPGSTVGRAVYTLRVFGGAIQNGEQDFIIGAEGGQLATSAQLFWAEAFQLGKGYPNQTFGELDINATPSAALTVQMANAETNIGASQGVVTLEFV